MSKEDFEDYDEDMFEDYGEGFEDEFDAVSEKAYEEKLGVICNSSSHELTLNGLAISEDVALLVMVGLFQE